MMLKLIPLTALALGLSSGVALADRHGDHRGAVESRGSSRPSVVVNDHRGYHNDSIVVRDRGWNGSNRGWNGSNRGWNGGSRVVYHGGGGGYVARRPIYVSRPIIRERYYNHYRRPSLIVESYNANPGYYWVAGNWAWDGGEWIWQPGHYQPDPNYVDQGYSDSGY
jgi:hypothetical protein